jgi:hypothetical protein
MNGSSMRVDAAGHHVAAATIDDLSARGRVERGPDRRDRLADHQDVGARLGGAGDDGAATKQDGHRTSVGRGGRWAARRVRVFIPERRGRGPRALWFVPAR